MWNRMLIEEQYKKTSFSKEWELREALGSGLGISFLSYKKGKPSVIKYIPFKLEKEEAVQSLNNDFKMLSHLRHQYLLVPEEIEISFKHTDFGYIGHVFLRTEYIKISLYRYLQERPLSFEKTIEIVSQIAEAVNFLHKKNLICLGIHPKNVFLAEEAMLGDPCLYWIFRKYNAQGEITPRWPYIPPELIYHEETKASDIYLLGLLLNACLGAKEVKHEFPGINLLIENMLSDNPKKRFDIERVLDELRTFKTSEWFLEAGIVFVQKGEFDKAKEYFEKAISLDEKNYKAWNNLGNVYEELENYEKAIDCYSNALKINNNYAIALEHRAKLFKKLGEHALAKKDEEILKEIS